MPKSSKWSSVRTNTVYAVVLLGCTFQLYAQNEVAKQPSARDHIYTQMCAFLLDHNVQLAIPAN